MKRKLKAQQDNTTIASLDGDHNSILNLRG